MGPTSEYDHLVQALSQQNGTELDMAVAILWYEELSTPGSELTVKEMAQRLQLAGLTARINITRLHQRLKDSRYTLKGTEKGSFRIALKQKHTLDEVYLPLLKRRRVHVSDDLLPAEQTAGTRPYIERISHQINGSYQYGFHDACAVLCRRLIESLLIDAFENLGFRSAIERNGAIVGLDEIIKQATSGQFIKLPKGTPKILEKVKEIGDTAAHDRYYITEMHDIAEFRSGFRKAAAQLMGLAGITSSK
jgi:hypothetical protein